MLHATPHLHVSSTEDRAASHAHVRNLERKLARLRIEAYNKILTGRRGSLLHVHREIRATERELFSLGSHASRRLAA